MHQLRDYSALVHQLDGLNPDLLEEHLKLYEGYVKKYNEINEKLGSVERAGNYSYAEHSELIRRRSVAWNGVRLHEIYFEGLTPGGFEASDAFRAMLERDFGSFDAWKEDMKACASATPGWVLLVQNTEDGALQHYVVYEHQNNYPADVRVLLALDCWEHAFAKQYGTNKGAYLETFFNHLDLKKAESRLV